MFNEYQEQRKKIELKNYKLNKYKLQSKGKNKSRCYFKIINR